MLLNKRLSHESSTDSGILNQNRLCWHLAVICVMFMAHLVSLTIKYTFMKLFLSCSCRQYISKQAFQSFIRILPCNFWSGRLPEAEKKIVYKIAKASSKTNRNLNSQLNELYGLFFKLDHAATLTFFSAPDTLRCTKVLCIKTLKQLTFGAVQRLKCRE